MRSSEPPPVIVVNAPPCERSWRLHLRDGEPYGLVVDGKPYRVTPLHGQGTGVREGDQLLEVVRTVPRP